MENQTQPTIEPPMPVQPAPQPASEQKIENLASQGDALQNQPKKSLPKWPLIVVGVILLATLLTGTYLLGKNQGLNQKPISKTAQTIIPTPTTTPISTLIPTIDTSSWKTFSNEYLSFKYPDDWKLDASNTNDLTLTRTQMMEPDGGGSPQPMKTTIEFKIKDIPTNYTLDQWFQDQYLVNGDQASFKMVKQFNKATSLDGVNTLFVTTPGAAGYLSEAVLSIKNNKGFNISIVGQAYDNNETIYKQILSTFKFTQ